MPRSKGIQSMFITQKFGKINDVRRCGRDRL